MDQIIYFIWAGRHSKDEQVHTRTNAQTVYDSKLTITARSLWQTRLSTMQRLVRRLGYGTKKFGETLSHHLHQTGDVQAGISEINYIRMY